MATIRISGLTHLEVIKVMEALGSIPNINFSVPQRNDGKLLPQKKGEDVTIRRMDFIHEHFCKLVNGGKVGQLHQNLITKHPKEVIVIPASP